MNDKIRNRVEEFITKVQAIHGNRYQLVGKYINTKTKVKMRCPDHGDWMAHPTNLTHKIQRQGCPACGNVKKGLAQRVTHTEFVKRVKKVHGDRYEILSQYVKSTVKVKLKCQKHGVFSQYPSELYLGYGCNKCGHEYVGDLKRTSHADFVKQVEAVHGRKYRVVSHYHNMHTKIAMECKKHGIWECSPQALVKGSGCAGCAEYGFNIAKPADFYLKKIRYQNKIYYGFGITNDLKQRDCHHGTQLRKHGAILLEQQAWHFANGKQALDIETAIKSDSRIPTDNILPIKGFVSEAFVAKDLSKAMKYLEGAR